MGRLQDLASRCGMNSLDLLTLARECAANPELRDVADLSRIQRQTLEACLEMMLVPVRVSYTLAA